MPVRRIKSWRIQSVTVTSGLKERKDDKIKDFHSEEKQKVGLFLVGVGIFCMCDMKEEA